MKWQIDEICLPATRITEEQQQQLTQSALSGWALGDAGFVADLQKRTERRVAKAAAGRRFLPKKVE